MMRNLITHTKGSALYAKMAGAIASCYAVDDCKEIHDQASAIAAYYKQIKDDESLRKFIIVKLRAWRRIGELCKQVSNDCETKTAYYAKINALFPAVSVSQISSALRLADVPDNYFEAIVGNATSVSGIFYGYEEHVHRQWLETPEGKAHQEQTREWHRNYDENRKKEEKARIEREQEAIAMLREQTAVWDQYVAANAEVGYTMDRRDRKKMK